MALPLFKKINLAELTVACLKELNTRISNAIMIKANSSSPCGVKVEVIPSKTAVRKRVDTYSNPVYYFFYSVDCVLEFMLAHATTAASVTPSVPGLIRFRDAAHQALDLLILDFRDSCVDSNANKVKDSLSVVVARIASLKAGQPITGVQSGIDNALTAIQKLSECFNPKNDSSFVSPKRILQTACSEDPNCAMDKKKSMYCIRFKLYKPNFAQGISTDPILAEFLMLARQNARHYVEQLSEVHESGIFIARMPTNFEIFPKINVIKASNGYRLTLYLEHVPIKGRPSELLVRCCKLITDTEHHYSVDTCGRQNICAHPYCRVMTGRLDEGDLKHYAKASEREWVLVS